MAYRLLLAVHVLCIHRLHSHQLKRVRPVLKSRAPAGSYSVNATISRMELGEQLQHSNGTPEEAAAKAELGALGFSILAENVFDTRKLTGLPLDLNVQSDLDVAIVVPTYSLHSEHFANLVQSISEHVTDKQGVTVLAVFSSLQEANVILSNCAHRCASTDRFTVKVLLFNVEYSHLNKFSYQSAKKLWAIQRSKADKVLVLDSDNQLLTDISLRDMIDRYDAVLYKTTPQLLPFDAEVNANVAALLKIQTPSYFPLELPWIYRRDYVDELVRYLSQEWGTENWQSGLLVPPNGPTYFEVILYRHFVKSRHSGFYATEYSIPDSGVEGFVFDSDLPDVNRSQMNPPPPGITCTRQQNGRQEPCHVCWLQIHNDRGCEE